MAKVTIVLIMCTTLTYLADKGLLFYHVYNKDVEYKINKLDNEMGHQAERISYLGDDIIRLKKDVNMDDARLDELEDLVDDLLQEKHERELKQRRKK